MREIATSGSNYDVFLSFKGEDTRTGFTGYLYNDLKKKKVNVFFDEYEIRRGSQITQELPKAIENSRIFIVVFSENYAYSSFCLDELAKIVEEFKRGKRLILPVFNNVSPCQLRHLRGSYGIAFDMHEERFRANPEKLEKWKMALHEVSNIYGWHITKSNTKYEFEWVSSIVEEVTRLHGFHHVERESQVDKVNTLLNLGSNDEVQMVGIYGIDKIPILTVVLKVYHSNAAIFDGLYILDNVKENSMKYGVEHLQKMLVSDVVGEDIKIQNIGDGISMMKEMLHQKKFLLVLHKVGTLDELQAIVGQTNWFGSGSRVIITTQDDDRSLLTSHGVERIYHGDRLKTMGSDGIRAPITTSELFFTVPSIFPLFAWFFPLTLRILPRLLRVVGCEGKSNVNGTTYFA